MDWMSRLTTFIRALAQRERLERDIEDELQFHLDMEAQAGERVGRSDAEARRQARIRLGGMEGHKEDLPES